MDGRAHVPPCDCAVYAGDQNFETLLDKAEQDAPLLIDARGVPCLSQFTFNENASNMARDRRCSDIIDTD